MSSVRVTVKFSYCCVALDCMRSAGGVNIRVGIVACEIFKKEIEHLTEGDPDIVYREYLEFALHLNSANLREKVSEKVNALKGKVDAVFLGYGICQSLTGITSQLQVPTAMLQVDDCIGAFLTPPEYEREKKICTGTWFMSPGWAELGWDGVVKELRLDLDRLKARGYDSAYFMRKLFSGYSRCLFIDTGVPDRERYEALSKGFAQRLNLRHDCRSCTLVLLENALREAKGLAERSNAK
ncbi:MAG: DUF1638 domain-containing protein [Candidatus Verstraetearchaeota archaeon]|nr:DUF1638 domain-containing protein [Candidatus Verstraetearchaeota archaeon]